MGSTYAALSAGSTNIKMVCAIEGYSWLLTDASPSAAVAAWSGTDWTQALGGLFVDMQNSQRIDPFDPFTSGGRCTFTVINQDNGDQFGIDVYRRSGGAESVLTDTIDRNDTTIPVASAAGFTAATSELFIGTECIEYSAIGASWFTASKRGKYSPFQSGGSGGIRFANHHRIAFDNNHVLLNPVVSQQRRIWLGSRVGIWIHTVDASGNLNTRDEAYLAYAGVIVGIADDPKSLGTKVELKHILDVIKDTTLGHDMWAAEIPDGLYLQTGRKFVMTDYINGGAGLKTSQELEVVASGAAGANQVNAGTYTGEQICNILNQWLGSEKTAGRLWGYHSWGYCIPTSNGLRTKNHFKIPYGSDEGCHWVLYLPGEVSAFLGLTEIAGNERGQTVGVGPEKDSKTNYADIWDGKAVPFSTLVFKPTGPGSAQEFAEALVYETQNERGAFEDQTAALPATITDHIDIGYTWGVFLLDEKNLIIGAYDAAAHTLTNAWISPWRAGPTDDTAALKYIGRRVDEPEAGPVTLRQTMVLTGTLQTILRRLFYGCGTSGYNNATYDTWGVGIGAAIPGELLGSSFDQSIDNLPGSQSELAIIFDEATKLSELLGSDLLLRRASLRWYNEHLEFVQWQTPAGALSRATLTDANKAAPASNSEDHRAVTLESTVFQRPIVKIDYDRDFSTGRNGDYRKSIQLEDQVAVDDSGGESKPLTIKARNTFSDFAGTGAAIEEITKSYLASMPSFSRSARHLRRSIALPQFVTIGVGDVVTVTDTFARDPATGLRGINSRYAAIVDHTWDIGGPNPDGTVRDMTGEVEIRFTDVNRHLPYGPAARVDDTAASGGYVSATKTLTCYAHQYSESSEAADASNFPAGYKIKVCQIDPDDPTSYLSWDDTIASQSGNTITLTTGLAGWDSTKRYRVTFDTYTDALSAQHDFAYEADATDQLVQDVESAYLYSSSQDTLTPTVNTTTSKAVFHADAMYGDGASHDAGADADLINTINQFIDRKSAHQMPMLLPQAIAGIDSSFGYTVQGFTPLYVGKDRLGVGVMRYLTIAPVVKGGNDPGHASGTVRVTLSRSFPMAGPSFTALGTNSTRFGDVFAQYEWPAVAYNDPLSTLATHNFKLNTKFPLTGVVWLTIETFGPILVYGLGECFEGPRTLL